MLVEVKKTLKFIGRSSLRSVWFQTADVAVRKRHQQQNGVFIFLPILHPENQQSCLLENSAIQYARETWCNHMRSLCTQHSFVINASVLYSIRLTTNARESSLVNNFADFPDERVKNPRSFCSVVGGISLQQHLSLALTSVWSHSCALVPWRSLCGHAYTHTLWN